MQHESAYLLRQYTRHERRHCTARASYRGYQRQGGYLHIPGYQTLEDMDRAGINRSQQEPRESDGDGIAGDRGHEPYQELQDEGAGCEEEDGRALADAVGEEGEREASQRNACPESRCDEANLAGVAVAELDEEGDYPS